jgi:hypothetical protein
MLTYTTWHPEAAIFDATLLNNGGYSLLLNGRRKSPLAKRAAQNTRVRTGPAYLHSTPLR